MRNLKRFKYSFFIILLFFVSVCKANAGESNLSPHHIDISKGIKNDVATIEQTNIYIADKYTVQDLENDYLELWDLFEKKMTQFDHFSLRDLIEKTEKEFIGEIEDPVLQEKIVMTSWFLRRMMTPRSDGKIREHYVMNGIDGYLGMESDRRPSDNDIGYIEGRDFVVTDAHDKSEFLETYFLGFNDFQKWSELFKYLSLVPRMIDEIFHENSQETFVFYLARDAAYYHLIDTKIQEELGKSKRSGLIYPGDRYGYRDELESLRVQAASKVKSKYKGQYHIYRKRYKEKVIQYIESDKGMYEFARSYYLQMKYFEGLYEKANKIRFIDTLGTGRSVMFSEIVFNYFRKVEKKQKLKTDSFLVMTHPRGHQTVPSIFDATYVDGIKYSKLAKQKRWERYFNHFMEFRRGPYGGVLKYLPKVLSDKTYLLNWEGESQPIIFTSNEENQLVVEKDPVGKILAIFRTFIYRKIVEDYLKEIETPQGLSSFYKAS